VAEAATGLTCIAMAMASPSRIDVSVTKVMVSAPAIAESDKRRLASHPVSDAASGRCIGGCTGDGDGVCAASATGYTDPVANATTAAATYSAVGCAHVERQGIRPRQRGKHRARWVRCALLLHAARPIRPRNSGLSLPPPSAGCK
jgi:hypothetical protein